MSCASDRSFEMESHNEMFNKGQHGHSCHIPIYHTTKLQKVGLVTKPTKIKEWPTPTKPTKIKEWPTPRQEENTPKPGVGHTGGLSTVLFHVQKTEDACNVNSARVDPVVYADDIVVYADDIEKK